MIFRYDAYKTIREFDNNLGLCCHTDFLQCCLSLHFLWKWWFYFAAFSFNIGHEGPTPHPTQAPSLHTRRIYSSYYSIAKSLKHLSVKEGKWNKGLLNPLLTKLGAWPCFSIPLDLGCCAKHCAVQYSQDQGRWKPKTGTAWLPTVCGAALLLWWEEAVDCVCLQGHMLLCLTGENMQAWPGWP